MERFNSNDFSINQILKMVSSSPVVQSAIQEGSQQSPLQQWSLIDIQDNLYEFLNLELDFDDTDTCGALLAYYNETQDDFVAKRQSR